MTKKRITITFVLVAIFISVAIISCATSIQTTVKRPAELDLGGAKSIAVLPFRQDSSRTTSSAVVTAAEMGKGANEDLNILSARLTNALSNQIAAGGIYDIINPVAVQTALNAGKEAPCDIYLTGYFSNYKDVVQENPEQRSRKLPDGRVENYVVKVYKRISVLSVNYELVDPKSYKILAADKVDLAAESSKTENREKVPTASYLLEEKIDKISRDLIKKIQPYDQVVTLTFLKDKTKDEQMAKANEMAKNKQIAAAGELFEKLYKEKGYMEAGYNAALIKQAQGDLQGAKTLMSEVSSKYGEPKAMEALAQINKEIQSAERLKQQMENR